MSSSKDESKLTLYQITPNGVGHEQTKESYSI